jgi:hypothetical protein
MSAEALASAPVAEATPLPPTPRPAAALLDAGLLNRLLGVATALFAVPVGVELHVLLARAFAGPANAPSAAAALSTFLAAALFAAGFGALLLRAPRTADLRAARVLACALGLEAAALAAALALRLAA